ncbi:MAG: hypothetical protein LUO80_02575 [Methylococcaceae bacterium]|jgi:hypothetical protein|nr:hypothetical protein [Methylococcaceae bacterium]
MKNACNWVRGCSGAVCIAASMALMACTALVDQFSGRGEACEILAIGKPASATIIGISDTGTTINNDPVVAFELEVHPDPGTPFKAKTRALISRLDVPQVQPGHVVPVKYDPQQPGRVAIDGWSCNQ